MSSCQAKYQIRVPLIAEEKDMSLTGTPTADLDPWCLVEIDGNDHLFGYAEKHDALGGRSWTRSSPVVEIDEKVGRARTESGRLYALGRRMRAEDISKEEAWLALEVLVDRLRRGDFSDPNAVDDPITRYLTARKIARHLDLEPPVRAAAEVDAFLNRHVTAYMRKLGGLPDVN